MKYACIGLLGFLFISYRTSGQTAQTPPRNYANYAQLTARLRTIAANSGGAATLQSVGKSVGGKDIWLLTVGRGQAVEKPALALVAGIEGSHLAGTELAVQMAEKLLSSSNDSVARLLTTKTLYIFPLVNPDAQEQAFSALKFERSGNGRDTDDDRDGRLNDDPFEDLNRDGLITQVRIEDPTGQYIPSKDDARVLIKADPAKGEVGQYVLISEGIDNDKDGQFNEDGPGGIALDKNFTFDYPFFTPGAGEMPVSEPENRALLDFLYKTPMCTLFLPSALTIICRKHPNSTRPKPASALLPGCSKKMPLLANRSPNSTPLLVTGTGGVTLEAGNAMVGIQRTPLTLN